MARANEATPPPTWHHLGTLGRTFQLAGGLRFYPAGELEAEALTQLDRVFVTGLGEARIRDVRVQGRDLIVWLNRARTRDQARALVNADVYADPADLPDPPEDAFYVDELIGLRVYLASEASHEEPVELGAVADVLATPGQDLLVVEGGRGEILLPLQAPYVAFDGERVLVIDPPEGLLDPSA